jgi:hypothetical protein
MVELLAGPLVGAAVADKLEAKNWGNLVLAVDPELLGDRDTIRSRTQVRADRVLAGASKAAAVGETRRAGAASLPGRFSPATPPPSPALNPASTPSQNAAPAPPLVPLPAARRPCWTASSRRRGCRASKRSCCRASAARASQTSGSRAA